MAQTKRAQERSAAEWEAEQERLERELAEAQASIEELQATIERQAFIDLTGGSDSEQYAFMLSRLSERRGTASKLRSALHLLPASLDAAREREAEEARAEAERQLVELRSEAVKACAEWDKALRRLAKSYGRLRRCHDEGRAPANLLGKPGLFPLRAYPFEESLGDELRSEGWRFDQTFPPHVTSVTMRGTGLAERLGLSGKD